MENLIYLISGVISITVLIVFFFMARNISRMTRIMSMERFERIKKIKEIYPDDIWLCPVCNKQNSASHYKCANCDYSMVASTRKNPEVTQKVLKEEESK